MTDRAASRIAARSGTACRRQNARIAQSTVRICSLEKHSISSRVGADTTTVRVGSSRRKMSGRPWTSAARPICRATRSPRLPVLPFRPLSAHARRALGADGTDSQPSGTARRGTARGARTLHTSDDGHRERDDGL
jgi:hypothetical protein